MQNVRQMKCLRISRHGKVRGGVLDEEDEDVDNEFKLSPSGEEDEFDTDGARGPRVPAGGASAAAGREVSPSWRYGGARRKRLSLPSIRLYSSLDSPGAYYGDQPPQPGTVVAQIAQDQAKNKVRWTDRNYSRL